MQAFYDIKQSFRRLYQDYEYSLTVILTMSLTLAIALFLLTIVYSIQYKPLPQVQDSDSVAWGTLQTGGGTYSIGGLSNYSFEYFKQHQTTLQHFGRVEQRAVTLSNSQMTEKFSGLATSHELFQALGVSPVKGRVLLASDDIFGAQRNIIISYELWDTLFNKSEDILSKNIKLDGEVANIVGVMPDGFKFPINDDVWFANTSAKLGQQDHGGWVSIFGRLKPNIEMGTVDEEFKLLIQQIRKEYPNQYKGKDISVVAFTERFAEKMGFLLSMLKIASLAILLMGCFSVSNLIIVRNLENAKEVLIKTALGIPFLRIFISLLMETFWLCLLSLLIGTWLCFVVIRYFGTSLLDGPYWWTLQFQTPIYLVGASAAFLIWISTGVIPLWMAARQPTNGLLSSGRKGGASATLGHVMVGFSVLQIFSAFILMVFTAVLIGGLMRIANADYGVAREGLLTAEVKLSGPRYTTLSERNQYYERFIEKAQQTVGIQSSAVTGALPGASGYLSTYNSTDRTLEIGGAFPKLLEMPISENYFSVMNLRLIEGRSFTKADKEGSQEVAVINQSMANMLFPNQSATGRQFQYDPENGGKLLTVIGVVPDVVSGNPLWYMSPKSKEWRSQMYRPISQMQPEWASNVLVFRTDKNPTDLTSKIKAIAKDIDTEIPLYNIKTLDESFTENEAGFRRLIFTFAPAAILALLISALSIYSITRRVVIQNTPDIGIMRAIGIEERYINRKYIGSSIYQLIIGLSAGALLSLVLLPLLPDSILITDVKTIFLACMVVATVIGFLVIFASFIPLLTAHRMSPRNAMNYLSVINNK